MGNWMILLCSLLILGRYSVADDSSEEEKARLQELENNITSLWEYINTFRHNIEHDVHELHKNQMEVNEQLDSVFGIKLEHSGSHMFHMNQDHQHDHDHHSDDCDPMDEHNEQHHHHGDHDGHQVDQHDGSHRTHHDDHDNHSDHQDAHSGHDDDHSSHSDDHSSHSDDHSGHGKDHSGHSDDHSGHSDDHSGHGKDHSGHSDDHSGHSDDHSGHDKDHSGHSDDHSGHSDDHSGHSDDHSGHSDDHSGHSDHDDHSKDHHDHGDQDHGSHSADHGSHDSHNDDHQQHPNHVHDAHQHGENDQHDHTSQNTTHHQHSQHHDHHHHHEEAHHHHHHESSHHHHHHDSHKPGCRYEDKYDFAICQIEPNTGIQQELQQNVRGRVHLWQRKNSTVLHIHIKVKGFKMDGHAGHAGHGEQAGTEDNHATVQHKHGFHIHRDGNLSNSCQSIGPHFNPEGVNHAGPKSPVRHYGDLGNIECDDHGVTNIVLTDEIASLHGPNSIIGRAMAIHQGTDDLGTNPDIPESLATGNAGPKIACCVIQKVDRLPRPQARRYYH